MNRERLKKLVQVLNNIETNDFIGEFNMNQFLDIIRPTTNPQMEFVKFSNGCNTSACALGYAALLPWFIKRGLQMNQDLSPAYKDYIGFEAAKNFFGLDMEDTFFIFNPGHYPRGYTVTPDMVSSHIQSLLNGECLNKMELET